MIRRLLFAAFARLHIDAPPSPVRLGPGNRPWREGTKRQMNRFDLTHEHHNKTRHRAETYS
jgi:hypothetical protein